MKKISKQAILPIVLYVVAAIIAIYSIFTIYTSYTYISSLVTAGSIVIKDRISRCNKLLCKCINSLCILCNSSLGDRIHNKQIK